jgi:hypothetical protein
MEQFRGNRRRPKRQLARAIERICSSSSSRDAHTKVLNWKFSQNTIPLQGEREKNVCTIGTGRVIYFVFNLKVCNREGDKIKHPWQAAVCEMCCAVEFGGWWVGGRDALAAGKNFLFRAGVAVENNVSLGAASIYYLI